MSLESKANFELLKAERKREGGRGLKKKKKRGGGKEHDTQYTGSIFT